MNTDKKLEQFAEKHYRAALESGIVPLSDNRVLVFGKWLLEPTNQGCQVSEYDQVVAEFADRRTALSWCVAEKHHHYKLSFTIKTLDAKKTTLGNDIAVRTQLARRSTAPRHQETVMTKLEPKINYYQAVKSELEKCIDLAKYMQIRGFSNETSRPSRGSSH